MNKVVRSNWYMEQGMIFYNSHYYLPATSSPLLPELLESLHATNLWLMAIGFYSPTRVITSAFPNSILLTWDWPQCILPSPTICFFDDNGRQFLSIDDIYISNNNISGQPSISPLEHNMGAMPPKRLTTALCVRIPNMHLTKTQIHNLHRPPKIMKALHYDATLPSNMLTAARATHGPTTKPGTYNYYIFAYIGSCQSSSLPTVLQKTTTLWPNYSPA